MKQREIMKKKITIDLDKIMEDIKPNELTIKLNRWWLNWILPLVKWFRINHTVYKDDLIIVTRYLKDGTIYHNELCRKCIEQYAIK